MRVSLAFGIYATIVEKFTTIAGNRFNRSIWQRSAMGQLVLINADAV